MEKEFIIKIYTKKDGARFETFVREIFSAHDKKDAFKKGREELIRIANCDLESGLSDCSENDILEEIKSIGNGSNNYYFDQTTYFFKVFSKSTKN